MKNDLKKQIREKMAALITVAFGLIAALAWNGAIRAIFAKVFGTPDTIVGMLIYAIVVTIIALIATIIIAKSIAGQEDNQWVCFKERERMI
mgnify:CR=1 FL=1